MHIGLFGRRNVGKSSLLNAITRQDVSIVSDQAGTTTDPVEKPMVFLKINFFHLGRIIPLKFKKTLINYKLMNIY